MVKSFSQDKKNFIDVLQKFINKKGIYDEQHLSEQVTLANLDEFKTESPEFLATLGTLKRNWLYSWGMVKNHEFKYKENPNKIIKKEIDIFTRRGQIESFWEEQPFYYDKSRIFWLWNKKDKKWELSDEIDFLNKIQEMLGIETIGSKARSELEAGFKQVGRKHKPKDIEKSWVQFKDKIYDVKTGESFEATAKYFVTNPIPWNVGENEKTPTIDEYFIEWVGEENKQSLYEFIAYNISIDKFMQRLFAFCGGGSNGKGTFIKLNYKFLGDENCVSSEIKQLSENQFEPAVLYRKLLCVMGEVAYNDLKNTNMLKKLGGEDKISFQFKGKTPFTAENTATCVSLTNSLPTTPDKSVGFYRKWKIEDFPNQFKEIGKSLIEEIPEIEFENLAKKSLRILKELYKTKKFHNEGTFKERERKYEERSNPVMRFIEESCEEDGGDNLQLRDFANKCNDYLKFRHLRIMTAIQIGRNLREEGFSVGKRTINGISSVVILNLKYKNKKYGTTRTTQNSSRILREETNKDCGSSGSSGSFQRDLNPIINKIEPKNEETPHNFKDSELKKAGYDDSEIENIRNILSVNNSMKIQTQIKKKPLKISEETRETLQQARSSEFSEKEVNSAEEIIKNAY